MNLGKVAKHILGTVAPTIASAVGGPFGAMAATVLQGLFPGDSDAEIERKLAEADPSILLQLKAKEQEFQVQMRELGIREDQLYVEDTDKARSFAANTSIGPQLFLTFLFIGIYAMMLFIFFTVDFELDDWQKGQLGILIGVVTTAVIQIVNFWFGTSKGSKDKTAIMGRNGHG